MTAGSTMSETALGLSLFTGVFKVSGEEATVVIPPLSVTLKPKTILYFTKMFCHAQDKVVHICDMEHIL